MFSLQILHMLSPVLKKLLSTLEFDDGLIVPLKNKNENILFMFQRRLVLWSKTVHSILNNDE